MSIFVIGCRIIKKLYEEGFTAFFAGGWVRDYLMGYPSDDIDIATDATTKDIQRIFPKTIPVGVNFGIVIIVEEGHQFETATFRKDQGYKDGRRPIGIELATAEEDAKRRDFTINGMFYDPIKKEIFDYVEGQKDIKKGIIRAIGNPHERFLEDRLRMIRAVRYASRFKFSIEEETLKAILDHSETLFPAVALERIRNELTKMAAYANFDLALTTLHRLNLLPVIFSHLKDVDIEEIKKRVELIPYFPEDAPVIAKLLELFPDASLTEKQELCEKLKLSNQEHQFVAFYHRAREILIFEKEKKRERFEWAHFYAHNLFPICLKTLAIHFPLKDRQVFLQEHHMRQDQLKKIIKNIQGKKPFLKSEDLRKAGIPNGKIMGRLLREGEHIAINEDLNDPQLIIDKLKQTSLWKI